MRVLHVIPKLAVRCGGPVTAILGMTSAQRRAGLQVHLLTTDHWADGSVEKVECEKDVFHSRFGPWQWSPELGRALKREVRNADVLNIHTLWSYPGMAAARACRAAGVPYILRPCGMLDQWSRSQKTVKKALYSALLERRNINSAAALWFTSEGERAGAQSFNYTCEDAVIPLGLAPEAFQDLPAEGSFRTLYPGLSDRLLILFLGRITPKKQTDVLLQAFAQISAEFPKASLVIAGPDEGSYLKHLKRLATHAGVADRVIFTGPLRGSEVQAAFVDAEVFVLPSLHENFGVSVIEAMACGVPVILSNLVNLAKTVQEAEAGLSVTPTVASLVSSLRTILSAPALARAMGQRGRKLALERFTWEGIMPSMIDLYERAINGRGVLASAKEPVAVSG